MKTKAEQIEELKATAVKLQQQIEALEKPKQWKPKYNELILSELKAVRTHLLLAYVKEFGGDWEADWKNIHQEKCYVYYGHNSHRWFAEYGENCCCGGTVYMSKDCAAGLVDKLNSGEVVL